MDKLTTDVGLVQDVRGLDQLRKLSTKDAGSQKQALEAAARQFESIFNQMWVSSMREANESIAPDSPLRSRYSTMFEGMLDEQRTSTMKGPGGQSSLAALIVKQLSPEQHTSSNEAQRTLKMPDERLPVMRRFARWEGNDANKDNVGVNVARSNQTTALSAGSESTINDKVAAAERFVARLERIERNFTRPTTAVASSGSGHFSSPEEFVRQLLPAAKQVAKRIGLSPVALLAQAALETGWGRNMMSNSDGTSGKNLFGIKAGGRWQGSSTLANSLEYEGGQPVMRKSAFRSYHSFVQSMEDYVELIGNNARYSKAKAVAHDPDAYFEALQQAGYATDPHYANKLKQVIRSDAFNGVWQAAEM
ncbi:MAG: flagellar assembly peptidoglycan hydrolase FlgJ [Aeromonadaceae bacterium]